MAAAHGAGGAGQMVTVKTAIGTTLQGYVTGPEDANRALLMLHDRWGLNGTVRQWSDRYGAKGYRVLAIDVFDERASDKMALATEIMKATDPETIKQNVLAGMKYLAAPRRVIATVGAGLGGWQSFQAAVLAPEQMAATVLLYGAMEATPKQIDRIHAPILAFYGKRDPQFPPAVVDGYVEMLKRPLSPHRILRVDAVHGFADPGYPGYNKALADEVWEQIDAFLNANMGDL